MARKLLKSAILLTAAVAVINGQSDVVSRYQAACGFLQGKVFCFGGNRGNITADIATDTTMYMLDLSKNATMVELASNWTLIQPNTNGVNLETRKAPQNEKISDTQLLISGGYGGAGAHIPIVDQTIVYDAETNSWSKYANYEEGSYGNRQIYYGASAFVPRKGAVFYGGFEQNINRAWTISTNQNITATEFGDGISRVIGYTSATFLNINQTASLWNVPTPQTNEPSVFSAFQTSVYSPVDQRIYYLGGTYQDTTKPGYQPNTFANWHPFTYALYFDTTTNTWGNQTLHGNIIPTNRRYHTMTILPNDQTKILLYGGETDSQVVSDYSFMLDLTTFTWAQVPFPVTPDGADLLRSRHSDILLDNGTLLMVFGLTSSGASTSRPLQFNISSSSSISYMSQYIAPPTETSVPPQDASSGLSSGAIAGIVVAIVVVLIIAAVIAFIYIRKKKNAKKNQVQKEAKETEQRLQSANHSQEPIEVNWDEIEKQYVEIPQPEYAGSISHKPNLISNDASDETATFVVSQSGGGSVAENKHYTPNIAQIPDEGTPTPYLIMKPDGGH